MKRALDVFVAGLMLLFMTPFMVAIALTVLINLGHPVFFRQTRPGMNGKLFELIKFRTMTDRTDEKGNLLPDELRLSMFGRMLRATSLDELPELWNVLRGDMSLVGPRPLLVQYLPLYTKQQTRRHEVRPGLTGWAQINGRNATTWGERLELDVWYVDNHSMLLDIRILFVTLWKVLLREGISQKNHVSIEPFKGED